MGQTTVSATYCCLKTQLELENIVGNLYTSIERQGKTWGTAAAVEQSSNGSFLSVIDKRKARPGDPGCTEVNLDVKHRIPDCGVIDDTIHPFDCSDIAAVRETYAYDRISIDDGVSTKFSVQEDMFNCSCEFPVEELAIKLSNEVRKLYTKYNNKLLTKLAAGVGSLYQDTALTSVTPAKLKLFRETPDGVVVPQPMGLYDLVYEYNRQLPDGGSSPLLVSGSKRVGAYEFSEGVFSGNVDGKDATRKGLGNVFTDWDMPSVLTGGAASEPMISFLPGTVELLDFYTFDNPDKKVGRDGNISWAPVKATNELVRIKIDLGTPILGRKFVVDMEIFYKSCENKVIYTITKLFDLWQMPQGAFCAGDTHNYRLLWDVIASEYDAADTV